MGTYLVELKISVLLVKIAYNDFFLMNRNERAVSANV